jgi:hypothetical protein
MEALTEKDLEYQRVLAAAAKFAVEDLEANRAGKMTATQRSKVMWRPLIGCFGLLILVGGLMIIGTIVSLIANPADPGFVAAIFGLIFLGIGILIAWRWQKEIKEARVERCEGLVLKVEEAKRVHTQPGLIPALMGMLVSALLPKNYFYQLDNGKKMKVPRAAYQTLDERRPHCVYYSPTSAILMAVEVLPDPGTAKAVPKFTQLS